MSVRISVDDKFAKEIIRINTEMDDMLRRCGIQKSKRIRGDTVVPTRMLAEILPSIQTKEMMPTGKRGKMVKFEGEMKI